MNIYFFIAPLINPIGVLYFPIPNFPSKAYQKSSCKSASSNQYLKIVRKATNPSAQRLSKLRSLSIIRNQSTFRDHHLEQILESAQIEHLIACFEREKKLKANSKLSGSMIHLMTALSDGIY